MISVTARMSIMAQIALNGINDRIVPETWHEVFYPVFDMRHESEEAVDRFKNFIEGKILIPSIEEFLRNE